MLVIADGSAPLVIAGVFGAVDAEIDEHTTDIVLEAANFDGPSILRTELHTGIRSEASNRFEKGLDPNLVPRGPRLGDRLFARAVRRRRRARHGRRLAALPPAPPRSASARPRPTPCSATRSPAAEQAGILRRLECEVDEGGRVAPATPTLDCGRSRRRRSGPTSSARWT